jgi:hypothetical protein
MLIQVDANTITIPLETSDNERSSRSGLAPPKRAPGTLKNNPQLDRSRAFAPDGQGVNRSKHQIMQKEIYNYIVTKVY